MDKSRDNEDAVELETRIQIPCIPKSGKDEVDGRRPPAMSYYHSKKSTAEGMMDISLLTANANQLKFIIFYNYESSTFYAALSLIILSLVVQVFIGFLLIFRRRFKSSGQGRRASAINEYLVMLIFLVTIINILAAVLTTTDTSNSNEKQ